MKLIILIFFFFVISVSAESKVETYFEHLNSLEKIERNIKDDLPLYYNQMCFAGYFTMPSARVKDAGSMAFCYSNSDPYQILGVNLQYFDHLELSGNFWIFKDKLEGGFGSMGFGDDADRSANIKVAILRSKDGFEYLPEIAIGINDFYGSKRFHSKYVVLTKQFIDWNLDATLGYGRGRIDGFFGALSFYPFFKKYEGESKYSFLKTLNVFLELDANNYKKNIHEHPKGREVNFPINLGLNFQFFKIFQASFSSIRGKAIAASIGTFYNIGKSSGMFPKNLDPPMYQDYIIDRDKDFSKSLSLAFKDQGLDLMKAQIFTSPENQKCLEINVVNLRYRDAKQVYLRLQNILSNISKDFFQIIVKVEVGGLNLHEYQFKTKFLDDLKENKITPIEMQALSPMQDLGKCSLSDCSNTYDSKTIFEKNKRIWILTLRPKVNAFFGSCKGKFKFDGGAIATQEGYFFDDLYYNLQMSYILKQGSSNVGSRDKSNPSQIINVRSDFVKYFETNTFHMDSFYIQKNWNLKRALFAKVALGYFEVAYAGLAFEGLYYPVDSIIAISVDFANVYKRKYNSIFGFQKKIRKFRCIHPEFENFIGIQYFLNLFLEIRPLNLTLKTSFGQFLAKDKGVKLELFRYFPSGLEISTWLTLTDKKDIVNHKRYFDKGFSITLPLDLFMNKSSRKKVNFKMSEWLRDVGAKAASGKELYPLVRDERHFR
ncbi:MAG: hypothetical protein K940chlam1_00974 [Candidatus Anoxychlamydiales bacterium]|nr:hypothetical protein [Candidatus Anoxychlamydiales bacterium]